MQPMKALVFYRTALLSIALGAAIACDVCHGGGIDHKIDPPQDAGIWSRGHQQALQDLTALTAFGGALWLGSDSDLGHTFWQSVDSTVLGAATAAVMKPVFSRSRPSQTDDCGQWFKGHGHNSFPSGEVMLVTTAVTPFVLEYGREHPLVYALELLPLYDGVARVKSQGHWQTDVLVSLAIGTGIGWYAHERELPISIKLLPRGITVGLHTRF